jgi:hypothetical protein
VLLERAAEAREEANEAGDADVAEVGGEGTGVVGFRGAEEERDGV